MYFSPKVKEISYGNFLQKVDEGQVSKVEITSTKIAVVAKDDTDKNYDTTVRYMTDHLDRMSIFAGTHNELSVYKLMDIMHEKGVKTNDDKIWFGQLYGMSDNISYNLAANGYNVAKYLPFGPVKDVMPYLIRRAEENTSVAGQTSRELEMIKTERKRRKGK